MVAEKDDTSNEAELEKKTSQPSETSQPENPPPKEKEKEEVAEKPETKAEAEVAEEGPETTIRADKPAEALDYREMVHNLRSPLTAILGMVELMKLLLSDDQAGKEEFEWYVNQIEQEALRMREMLR